MTEPSTERRANQISPDELLDLGEYERQRDTIRPKVMATRNLRRIELGPNATVAFENRETVRYQIQEMLRAERLAKPQEVAHEIETYNDLLPSTLELSATLMLEFPEQEERRRMLEALVGFDQHLLLRVGDAGEARAFFDRRQYDAEKISSVQFVRFPLTEAQRKAILDGSEIALVSEHPQYSHSSTLTMEQAEALAEDLLEAEGD